MKFVLAVLHLSQSFVFRLLAAFFVIILLMFAFIGGGIYATNQLLAATARLDSMHSAQTKLLEMKADLLEANLRIGQFVMLNQYQALFEYAKSGKSALEDDLNDYQKLVENRPEEAEFIANVKKANNQFNEVTDRMLKYMRSTSNLEATALLQFDFAKEANRFNDLLSNRVEAFGKELNQQIKATDELTATSQFVLLLNGIGAALIAIVLAVVLAVVLGRRVKKLEKAVVELGRGNLAIQVVRPGRDELGRVGLAFNQMAARLRTLIENIENKRALGREAGEEVNEIVTQLSSAVAEQSQGATQQSAAIAEVTSTLEELGATAQVITRRTAEVAESAGSTLDTANALKEIVTQTSTAGQVSQSRFELSTISINEVETHLTAARNALAQLVEQSERINSITVLMHNIANETHLLALNGAIEAAGAGQFGERFGIVAAEVKSLADRSRKATAEVSQVIGAVRASIKELEKAVEETTYSSQESVRHSQEAGEAIGRLGNLAHEADTRFSQIVEDMATVADLAEQIKLSILQQGSSSAQLVDTMRLLNTTSRAVAASSNQLAQTAYQLQQVSTNMTEKMAS